MRSVSDLLRDTRVRRAAAWSPRGADSSSVLNVIAGNYDCGLKCAVQEVVDTSPLMSSVALDILRSNPIYFGDIYDAVYSVSYSAPDGITLINDSTAMAVSTAEFVSKGLMGLDVNNNPRPTISLADLPDNTTVNTLIKTLNTILASPTYLYNGSARLVLSVSDTGHLELRYQIVSTGAFIANPKSYTVGLFFGDYPNIAYGLGVSDDPDGLGSTGIFLGPGQDLAVSEFALWVST